MSRIKVLLVDDSRALSTLVSYFLSKNKSLEVVGIASSGREALAMMSLVQPDLVLMDLAMPGMTGIEATHMLKSRIDAPRVIILTAHTESRYKKAAYLAGADGFLNKSDLKEKLIPLIDGMFNYSGCGNAAETKWRHKTV